MGRPKTRASLGAFLKKLEKCKFQRFSTRSSKSNSSGSSIVTATSKFLKLVSGGDDRDVSQLVLAYLKSRSAKKVFDFVSVAVSEDLRELRSGLVEASNSSKDSVTKRNFLQFDAAQSRSRLLAHGYKVGRDIHRSTRAAVDTNGGRHLPLKRRILSTPERGGRKRVRDMPGKGAQMEQLLSEFTEVMANRIHEAKACASFEHLDETAVMKTLTAPPTHVGDIAKARGICCRNALFAELCDREDIVLSKRLSDLCRYCILYRHHILLEPRLLTLLLERNDHPPPAECGVTSVRALRASGFSLCPTDDETAKNFVLQLSFLEFHRFTARRQRETCNRQVECCSEDTLPAQVFVLYPRPRTIHLVRDYAEAEELCHSGRDADWGFRNRTSACIQIFVIRISGLPSPIYIVDISNVLNKTSEVSCFSLGRVLGRVQTEHPDLFADAVDLHVWNDRGSHYVSHLNTGYVLGNLHDEFSEKNISQNTFGNKHGKYDCDTVAQKLKLTYKTFLKYAAATGPKQAKRCDTHVDLANIYEEAYTRINQSRAAKGLRPVSFFTMTYGEAELDRFLEDTPIYDVKIPHLHSTYCLRRPKGPGTAVYNATFSDLALDYVAAQVTGTDPGDPPDELDDDDPPDDDAQEGWCVSKPKTKPEITFKRLGNSLRKTLDSLERAGVPADVAGVDAALLKQLEPSERVLAHRVEVEKLPAQTRDFEVSLLLRQLNRLVYFRSHADAFWRFGKIVGAFGNVDNPDIVIHIPNFVVGDSDCGQTSVPESLRTGVRELVRDATQKRPTLHILKGTLRLPVHSVVAAHEDSWQKCVKCAKWRIVLDSALAQACMSPETFICIGGCHSAFTCPREAAGQEPGQA